MSMRISPSWIILSVISLVIFILQIGILLLSSSSSSSNNDYNVIPHGAGLVVQYPIILVGLPYSGSLAVHDYVKCHGLSSIHYCCDGSTNTEFPCPSCGECILKNLQSNHSQPPFDGCFSSSEQTIPNDVVWSRYDMETSETWFLPQHFTLGLLHQSYPNATWILQTRSSARDWAESIYHWHSRTRRIFHAYEIEIDPPHTMSSIPVDPSTTVTEEDVEIDMELQLKATIYQWANQFRSHKLIHINVDDPQSSIRGLNNALGIMDSDHGKKKNKKKGPSCEWTFQSTTSGDDWKDFSFPFSL